MGLGIPRVTGPVGIIAFVYLTSIGLLHVRHVDDGNLLAPPSNPAAITPRFDRNPPKGFAQNDFPEANNVSALGWDQEHLDFFFIR